MTLLICGGLVFKGPDSELQSADILIEGGIIAFVGKGFPVPINAQKIDAQGHIILPGLINAHTHAHNNLMKGLADNWSLEDLRNHGVALYSGRTSEEQYLSAAIGAVEMLKCGCTAAYDQFLVPSPTDECVEATVRAYTDVGLRAVIAPCIQDIGFYQMFAELFKSLPPKISKAINKMKCPPTRALLQLTENAIRRWNGSANGRIHIGVAPVIPGECTDELMTACLRLVREYGVNLHTHLCETKVQAIYGLRRWGKTIVSHLENIGVLGPHFIGGHGVWITDTDIQLLADTGSMIAHLPASNLKLGSGIAPVSEMLRSGVNVGLGTDGSMSSDNQNMFEAMRFAALVDKVRSPHQQERWIGAASVWDMATIGSARILGMADEIGIIEKGRKADLTLLHADSVFLRPLNSILNSLVYAETGADVVTVIVGGRVVFDHGHVLTVNEERLLGDAQKAADRLRSVNTGAWELAKQLTPYITMASRAAVVEPYPVNRYATTIIDKQILNEKSNEAFIKENE